MARILIFDSKGPLDSLGEEPRVPNGGNHLYPFTTGWTQALSAATAIRTYPVRIHSSAGEITVVDYEFFMDFDVDTAVAAVRWFQEFYNDDAGVPLANGLPPAIVDPNNPGAWRQRDWPGIPWNGPWARELVAVSGGGGVITLTPAQRNMNMQKRGIDYDCLRAPLSVYGRWVRLAIWVDLSSSTDLAATDSVRLRVFAHVGGHSERKYLHENGRRAYAYNAFLSS